MRVYIGGSFASRGRLRAERDRLRGMGYTVVASWIDEPGESWPDVVRSRAQAARDMEEMQTADLFIFDTLEPSTFGNNFVEWGIALTRSGPKYLVGEPLNHYHLLLSRGFDSWEELAQWLLR